jgi:hypothetical protein
MKTAARFRTVLSSFCLVVAAVPVVGATASVGFDRAAIQSAARELAPGGELRVAAVPWALDGSSRSLDLRLARFEVFAPSARIVLHTEGGERYLPVPANVYLRGTVEGKAGSRVVLSVLATGEIRGLATALGRTWLLQAGAVEGQLRLRAVDGARELEQPGGGFRCALDDLGPAAFRSGDGSADEALAAILDAPGSATPAALPPAGEGGAFDHTAVIAIETDNEFLNLPAFGGNTTDATNYIADLVAYSSTIYTDELQTSWVVGDVSLWAVADPWQQTSPSCGLIDFGRYWNNNHAGIARTVTHFLSGKSTNAGIAWVGVLCSGAFNIDAAAVATGCSPPLTGTSNWGGGYGYTSGIDGNFNINIPSVVWDIEAFAHEIGHNFNSPHTHCYQNVGGNAASVDNCYAGQCGTTGCYCGTAALPGPSGVGAGTIMSYCHLLGGGLGNTSLTLGLGHPFGVAPERVPNRMRSHVVSVASGNPSCLAPIGIIFIDGFGSGNTGAWSATVP